MSDAALHPNVVAYRRMMAAFNAGDLSTISELVAANVEYVVPGKSPLAGHTHDIAGLVEMLGRGRR
jgi:ketosteroid isomerase-like protein